MVICLERGADLHMAQLMPQPLTVSCFSKIQIGFTFLVPAHLASPEKGRETVCVTLLSLSVYHKLDLAGIVLKQLNKWSAWFMHITNSSSHMMYILCLLISTKIQ